MSAVSLTIANGSATGVSTALFTEVRSAQAAAQRATEEIRKVYNRAAEMRGEAPFTEESYATIRVAYGFATNADAQEWWQTLNAFFQGMTSGGAERLIRDFVFES